MLVTFRQAITHGSDALSKAGPVNKGQDDRGTVRRHHEPMHTEPATKSQRAPTQAAPSSPRGTPAGKRGELLTLASCGNSAGARREKDTVAFFCKEGSQQNLTIQEGRHRVGTSICLQAKCLAKGQHKLGALTVPCMPRTDIKDILLHRFPKITDLSIWRQSD